MTPRLVIRKRMQFIQGRNRPCCFVQALIDGPARATIEEHFSNEPLFKRAFYSASWPAGAIAIPAALGPSMSQFLKNDACPEITVKTLLAGQLHQGANVWETMSFEFIAKLAFDNFRALVNMTAELDRDVMFNGSAMGASADAQAFDADMAAELKALSGELAA